MKAVAWGRLLRLSLAPSAVADALAGITLGAWGAFPLDARAALMPLASLCVFHGGMALNDWADRADDAATRPDRPIPSGAVPASRALGVALVLLVGGPLLAALVSPLVGACLGGVALTAALYDVAGRGALLGPSLLGLCRAGNLAVGVLAGAALSGQALDGVPHWAWVACGLYGLYVFSASRLARLEDDEDERPIGGRAARAVLAASACLAVAPWTAALRLGPALPSRTLEAGLGYGGATAPAYLALAVLSAVSLVSALGLVRVLAEDEPWTRPRVGRTAGMALRRLLVFTAVATACAPVVAFLAGEREVAPHMRAWVVAPLLLLGYPIALRLRRVFPPT